MKLSLGISPCPNDTFIFHGLTTGLVKWGGSLDVTFADVQELNMCAARGELDIVKVSVAAAAEIMDDYILLRAGGAMGYGAGPVLIAAKECSLESLEGRRVAIPGKKTTANLLFGACCREAGVLVDCEEAVFDQIMPMVQSSAVDAGVVIHEGRFTFADHGMKLVQDLGVWWEHRTGFPIPLGAIAIRRSLGADVAKTVNDAIQRSIQSAYHSPDGLDEYIRNHAQELDEAVIREHIKTFVTDYSFDIGETGVCAVNRLFLEAGHTCQDTFIKPD